MNLGAKAAERPVFTIENETYSWPDVVAAARARGEWEQVEHQTRAGLACLQRLRGSGDDLDESEVDEAAAQFRYQRRLLAGEEMEEWLERWQVRVSEWRDYLRRALLRERCADQLDETVARYPVDEDDVAAALWAEAVCSALLEQFARRLAGDAALAVEAGETLAGDREHTLRRIEVAAERARAEAATEEAVEHEVAEHALEWLRVDGQLLEVPAEDTAREVALCVRADGRPLAEVAAECEAEPRPLSVYIGEVEGELASTLLAARAGELVGPLARDGGFALVLVETKAQPSAADPDVRRKAVQRVVSRAADRAFAAHVEWHERL